MRIFGFAGWSGSGKTTLIEQVIPRLTGRGLRVSSSSMPITGSTSTSPARIPTATGRPDARRC